MGERQPFVMPSSKEVAQSFSAPNWIIFFKCPTLTELYLSSVQGGGQRLGAHACFCGTCICLLPTLISFLATNTATGRCRTEGEGGSQAMAADQGRGGQAGTRQPRHNTVPSCPRGRQEGMGAGRGWPALCVEADTGLREAQGDALHREISPAAHLPSFGMRRDRRCEGVQGRLSCPHAAGWADAQSRQKTYSV